jgi:hypothetical protein
VHAELAAVRAELERERRRIIEMRARAIEVRGWCTSNGPYDHVRAVNYVIDGEGALLSESALQEAREIEEANRAE